MVILMGDTINISRQVGDDTTWVTGRITGIIQKDNGDLRYFYIKGIDNAFWMSDGWVFSDEQGDEDA